LLRRLQTDEQTQPERRPRLLFASGFKRALQTCRHVSEATGLVPSLELSMHEEGGIFEGTRREAREQTASGSYVRPLRHGLDAQGMQEHLPGVTGLEVVAERGWWRGGVETVEQTVDRANACMEWLWQLVDVKGGRAGDLGPGAAVCVTHGLFLDRLLKASMGIPATAETPKFLTANCAYWLLELVHDPQNTEDPRRVVFLACNVVDHVPTAVRTGHKMGRHSHCQPSFPELLTNDSTGLNGVSVTLDSGSAANSAS
jgi:broad specificity phosphatase PhoE